MSGCEHKHPTSLFCSLNRFQPIIDFLSTSYKSCSQSDHRGLFHQNLFCTLFELVLSASQAFLMESSLVVSLLYSTVLDTQCVLHIP